MIECAMGELDAARNARRNIAILNYIAQDRLVIRILSQQNKCPNRPRGPKLDLRP